MTPEELLALSDKYLAGTASPEEREKLQQWYLRNTATGLQPEIPLSAGHKNEDDMEAALYEKIKLVLQDRQKVHAPVHKIVWTRWVAAASILFLLGLSSYFIFFNKPRHTDLATLPQSQRFKNDIDPVNHGAVLITADGKRIVLDSVGDGRLKTDGNVQPVKNENAISYNAVPGQPVYYETIATDKGKNYHLTLADGTQVWLDAMSSIHFPTSFPGAQRVVAVTGQAYFEVAKDPAKKFILTINGKEQVEVYGTHFNVNAYDNEDAARVTLLEGSVKVSSLISHDSRLIKPGEQAILTDDSQFITQSSVDLDQVMAWLNGRFQFEGASMHEIMNQVSRWYDMDVVYQDKINETFVAKIQRNLPLSRLLNLLEMTKQVAFTIDGNKVTVMKIK